MRTILFSSASNPLPVRQQQAFLSSQPVQAALMGRTEAIHLPGSLKDQKFHADTFMRVASVKSSQANTLHFSGTLAYRDSQPRFPGHSATGQPISSRPGNQKAQKDLFMQAPVSQARDMGLGSQTKIKKLDSYFSLPKFGFRDGPPAPDDDPFSQPPTDYYEPPPQEPQPAQLIEYIVDSDDNVIGHYDPNTGETTYYE